VPDNQEVWVQRDGDQSIIIEIVEAPDDAEVASSGCAVPAEYHFADVAGANAAAASSVTWVRQVEPSAAPGLLGPIVTSEPRAAGTTAWLLRGTQRVAKFKGDAAGVEGRDVCMLLAVVRLPPVGTDILVTWNVPPSDTEAGAGGGGRGGRGEGDAEVALLGMEALLASLRIRDYRLFTP